jgi:hypothetical protein
MSRVGQALALAFAVGLAQPALAQGPKPAGTTPVRPGAAASTPAPKPGPSEIVNIDAGKTGEQLFKANCAICHKTAAGLSRAGGLLGVQSFLREHYTASRESAAVIGAYLYSIDAAAPARATRPRSGPDARRTSKKPDEVRPADVKPTEPKPADAKPADVKPAEAKVEEPPRPSASVPENKPADSKPADTPPVEAKPAAPAEPKPADAPKSE